MKTKFWTLLAATAAAMSFSGAAVASAGVGVGLGWSFGGPKGVSGATAGIKVFSTDKEDKAAASLGLDYAFAERSFRPNVGVAYIGKNNIYLDANVGYLMSKRSMNFGLGAGYVDTKK